MCWSTISTALPRTTAGQSVRKKRWPETGKGRLALGGMFGEVADYFQCVLLSGRENSSHPKRSALSSTPAEDNPMRCQSTSTITTDGYRAGSEIGEALRALGPEVIFLFASVTYAEQFQDVFDGLN